MQKTPDFYDLDPDAKRPRVGLGQDTDFDFDEAFAEEDQPMAELAQILEKLTKLDKLDTIANDVSGMKAELGQVRGNQL